MRMKKRWHYVSILELQTFIPLNQIAEMNYAILLEILAFNIVYIGEKSIRAFDV